MLVLYVVSLLLIFNYSYGMIHVQDSPGRLDAESMLRSRTPEPKKKIDCELLDFYVEKMADSNKTHK